MFVPHSNAADLLIITTLIKPYFYGVWNVAKDT